MVAIAKRVCVSVHVRLLACVNVGQHAVHCVDVGIFNLDLPTPRCPRYQLKTLLPTQSISLPILPSLANNDVVRELAIVDNVLGTLEDADFLHVPSGSVIIGLVFWFHR